jgi:hypothetical protein
MRQDQNFLLICMSIQLPNVWEDELHNVVQMSYGTSAPLNSQDADGIIFYPFCTNPLLWYTPYCSQVSSVFAGSLPHSHMKVEP